MLRIWCVVCVKARPVLHAKCSVVVVAGIEGFASGRVRSLHCVHCRSKGVRFERLEEYQCELWPFTYFLENLFGWASLQLCGTVVRIKELWWMLVWIIMYILFKKICRYLKMINSLMLKSPGFWKMMEGAGMPFCVAVSAFYVGMGIVS